MVRFEDVALKYGSEFEVLHHVSLHLPPGSFHFVTGPSGAGKSSLLQMMYLAQRPSSGRMTLFGRDVESLSRDERALLRRRVGVVFQDFRLLRHLTVAENVALPLRIAGRPTGKVKEHVTELLAWVGLADHFNDLPEILSGGQQQRVAIARAVISQPSLLLADEPTGNVDDKIAVRLLYLFEELNKLGTTLVIATHSQALMSRFSHPVLRLAEGSVRLELPHQGRAPAAPLGSAV